MLSHTHRIYVADAHAHLLGVETLIEADGPLPRPLVVSMPVWTPGSYLVREHARRVESLEAHAGDTPLRVRKVRKNAWSIDHPLAHRIVIRYSLYANELTVRTNHVDTSHAYWNGASTYLTAQGATTLGARVKVDVPAGWRITTSLTSEMSASEPASTDGSSPADRPLEFVAHDFDELCDSPFECGEQIAKSFLALGKSHRFAIWDTPDARHAPWDRICEDTKAIVQTEARLYAGDEDVQAALPYQHFLFIWHVVGRVRGGLEHGQSCTLMIKPQSWKTHAGYLEVLSLVAHEFFHLWNVKRIRPRGLAPYRYDEENYTRALWWFEGATSYYDWRVLRMAELATATEYLDHLAGEIAKFEDTPGAAHQSLEDASFDAWIKAYRPDENTANSTISYYLKGELVCMLFDLEIRRRSSGRASLDDVLRHLWRTHGRKSIPLEEDALPEAFASATGVAHADLAPLFDAWVRGTSSLPLEETLGSVGLQIGRRLPKDSPEVSLGLRTRCELGRTIVDTVLRHRAGHRAGIDVHDELLAIANRRVADGRVDACLAGLGPGQRVPVLLARNGWVRTLEVELEPARLTELRILRKTSASPETARRCEEWLGAPFETLPKA